VSAVKVAQRDQRTMQPDPLLIARCAQQADDALAFAQRVDPHQMGAFGEGGDGAQQLADLARIRGVLEDWQGEGGFGDENIARHRFERRTGIVVAALVVARDDDALATIFEDGLGRAEDMTGRYQTDIDLSEAHTLAVGQTLLARLGHVGEAAAHDGQSLGSGQRGAMAGPGVVAMTMRDQRARHGHRRIDIEIAGDAIEPPWRRVEPGARIGRGRRGASRCHEGSPMQSTWSLHRLLGRFRVAYAW